MTALTMGEQAVNLAALKMQEMGVSRHEPDGSLCTTPEIQMNHVDGPMLVTRFGEPYWLSLVDRFMLKLGWTNAIKLEQGFYLRRFLNTLRKSN